MADFTKLDEALLKPRVRTIASSTGTTVKQQIPPLSVSSRNRIKAYCRAICQWGVDNDLISSNPFAKFRPDRKKEGKAPGLITDEEIKAIWKVAAPHLTWAIKCIMYLGVRPGASELFALKMSDIDLESSGIWVTRGKTNSPPTLQIFADSFLSEIKKLKDQEPNRVWLVEFKGKQVGSLKTAWATALRRAGISRRLRLYDLRHWYATNLIMNGADIKSAAALMGHSSPSLTLKTYAHIVEGQKRKVANLIKLPSIQEDNSK